jgi:site-specific recombinase XerC
MHKARHTAGERVLDHTGNLKAAQRLLGHASFPAGMSAGPRGESGGRV